MSEPSLTEAAAPPVSLAPSGEPLSRGLVIALIALVAAFAKPLYDVVQLSFANSLYSHLPLIPLVSAYFIWIQRADRHPASPPLRPLAIALLSIGLGLVAAYFAVVSQGAVLLREDELAWLVYAFLFLVAGLCAWFVGRSLLRTLAFPLGFLIFMAPFPVALHDAMESFLQHTSADAAYFMISSAGTPILRDSLIFHLPGIVLEVAPQCSGIRSSVALFITSVVAGYFFLRSPWKRAILTFAVIPLAILRNGLRIFTIAQLCVHVSPDMVNSFIHHRGGPIFFALSLVPFFGLLYFLYRSDARRRAASTVRTPSTTAGIVSR